MSLFDRFRRKQSEKPDASDLTSPADSVVTETAQPFKGGEGVTNDAMRKLSGDLVQRLKDEGVNLDFSEKSVSELAEMLGELHEYLISPENNWTEAMIRSNARGYGAYIGEVLIRKYGGEWEEGNVYNAKLLLGRVQVWPASKVWKLLKFGRDDDLWIYYESLTRAILPASGNETAMKEMRDNEEVFAWFKKKADAGDAENMWRLGLMYQEGRGAARDYSEAVKWFRKSAELGEVTACNLLASVYAGGLGFDQNFGEVFKWTLKAAEAGDAGAMFLVGKAYSKGLGVAQDKDQSIAWMKRSATAGDADAREWQRKQQD